MRVAVFLIVALVFSSLAVAQDAQPSRTTYLQLMDVQEAWEKEDYNKAFTELQTALNKAAGKPLDIAVIQQYVAHTAILSGQDHRARPALENAMQQPGLPLKLQTELSLFLGQIVLGDEDFEEAKRLLEFWIANTESDPPGANLFSLAYSNYMTGDLPRAEMFIERAIASGDKANNSWFQVYYQVLFEQKKFAKALVVLHGLVDSDPNEPRYWRMLSNHHMQVEEAKKALAAMSIAYQQGMFDQTADLKRVSSLYGYVEVPEKAARLTEQWVSEGLIEEDVATLRRLGDLWMLARHRGKAKGYLKRAADQGGDPKTIELLGSLYFEDEEWRLAHASFKRVLESEGRRDTDGDLIVEDALRIHMLAGICAMRAGMKSEARASLTRAMNDPGLRGQARALLKELNES